MPVYQWVGKNRKNEVQKGEIEAVSEEAVTAQLTRQRITPTKVKKKPKDLFENVSFLQPKVKERDVILFARQFSTMIDAGLPIIQCLDILYSQQANTTFKKMLKDIKESVEGGATLAEALKKFPKQFDNLFVNMIAAGEAGGILDGILRRLAAYMEKAAKLKAQVKGAMTYPIVTLNYCGGGVSRHFGFCHSCFRGNVRRLRGRTSGPDPDSCSDERYGKKQNYLYYHRTGSL